ncbi:site-specific integrase [Haloglomus irregulare]|jgi:integrase|uniref:Site-specific integrase n=1 Tax=Haloglomus irregulare TaxID=2234134 RepID=A0A554NCH4_9EURY|nr:site-specific integrase [Haloglomus irregulare]TSD15097.1 site-specific integrase [Haloglomus irregulare]
MQHRPYPEKSGRRIWLSRSEQQRLLDQVEDQPKRQTAMWLGLHGLRSDEIVGRADEPTSGVQYRYFRELANGADGWVLEVTAGKTGRREVPVSSDLVQQCRMVKNVAGRRQDEPLVDVTTRSLRNWIRDAREVLNEPAATHLGMHDLRRTFATDAYYSLALAGVPIAEQLVMSYGGWEQSEAGRNTFRSNYLGPVPDHVTAEAMQHLPAVAGD